MVKITTESSPIIRTRFAPSPTGHMHIGNLRTALYEYLIAKNRGGKFILRIEDTDQSRYQEDSLDVIFDTLHLTGLVYDEGPKVGGDYGPYIQSERKGHYLPYAKELIDKGKAYYCFCSKGKELNDQELNDQELDAQESKKQADENKAQIFTEKVQQKYNRHCYNLPKDEIAALISQKTPYVIRQLIPEGKTTFSDQVFGDITIDHKEIEDQILIKSDGMPTYNFANVIDDHTMAITHVVRGSEYLTSTPKYKLLYEAFGWEVPTYIHLPLMLNESGEKISKRRGDASISDLIDKGYLPEAIINYCALLGWSPSDNREFFTLQELVEAFDIKNISKSPSLYDPKKLDWINGEYFKNMDSEVFFEIARETLESTIKTKNIDLREVAKMVQTRILFVKDIYELVDFIDQLPDYDITLYTHKKMKTDPAIALTALEGILTVFESKFESESESKSESKSESESESESESKSESKSSWNNENLYAAAVEWGKSENFKNSQILWPIRTALSGKPSSPCGASELCALLGQEETVKRIKKGIEKLKG